MAAISENFLTPVGRLVQGSAFEPQTKDMQGNPLVVKTGPNAGQPAPKYILAVAFRKDDPAWPALKATLDRVAKGSFPQFFPNGGDQCTHPQFSFKIVDGDGIDSNGKPNRDKPGFAGHWVLRISGMIAPKVFHKGAYDPTQQVTNPRELPRGYYVRVSGYVKGNDNLQKPGLYVNAQLVEIFAPGEEIVSGPDASQVFGATAGTVAAPPGALAAPGVNVPVPMPAVAAPPAPPAKQMTAKANGATYDAMIAAGWTDAMMIEQGYMVAPVAPVAPAAPSVPVPSPVGSVPTPAVPAPTAVVPVPSPVIPNPDMRAIPAPTIAPVRHMTAAANGATYEQLVAAGWTDALLLQHGMMTMAA